MFITEEVKCHAATALAIQNASNLGAVVTAWSNAQPAIRAHAAITQSSFTNHPVQLLFLSKITSLMAVTATSIGGVEQGDADVYREAYSSCRVLAGESR